MTKLRTPPVRTSFTKLISGEVNTNEAGKETTTWTVSLLLKKGKKEDEEFLANFKKEIAAAMKEKFGKVVKPEFLNSYCIHDGDAQDEDGNVREEHAGHWVIRCRSYKRPNFLTRQREPIVADEDLYSGSWIVATVNASAYVFTDPKAKVTTKGVSCRVLGGIKWKDDEPFGDGINVEEEYSDLMEDEGAPPPAKGKKVETASEDDDLADL